MFYRLDATTGDIQGAYERPVPGDDMVVELPDDDARVAVFHIFEAALANPKTCTKLGLKRAFAEKGLWPTVKGFIAADPDRQDEWDLATEVRLTDPLVTDAVAALAAAGITIDPVALAARANALVA